ncbi:MAG: WG repeat-containing protein [Bryobacteraceae bacterium]
MDEDGRFAIPPGFTATGRFRGGVCLVTTNDEIGYINTTGEFVWKGPFVDSPLGFDLRF